MKNLKTTKIACEGEEPKCPQTSPAEWASALLEKVSEAAAQKTASVKKPKKSSDNTSASKRKSAKD